MSFTYPASVTIDTAGFFLVTFPDIPEAGTDAETRDELLDAAPDALIAALGGYIAAQRPLPFPSPAAPDQVMVVLPVLVVAKLALYEAMLAYGHQHGTRSAAREERRGRAETGGPGSPFPYWPCRGRPRGLGTSPGRGR